MISTGFMIFKSMQNLTCNILLSCRHFASSHGHENSTSMQFSYWARCTANSLVFWFCGQWLFCSNSRRDCASPCPPAHILPGFHSPVTACKYGLRAGFPLREMLHRQWDLGAAIVTACLIRVGPWNVIAVTSRPWEPHAQTPGDTRHYHTLDVKTCLRGSFANTMLQS